MKELICIVCPKGCHLKVDEENGYAVTGNSCPRGAEYGKNELSNPTRMLTSTVCIEGGIYPRLPVKTSQAIPKSLLFAAMDEIAKVRLTAPVTCGQVLIPNLLGTGADLVASRDMEAKSEPTNKTAAHPAKGCAAVFCFTVSRLPDRQQSAAGWRRRRSGWFCPYRPSS